MKFLCLVCAVPVVTPMSEAEAGARFAAYVEFNDGLRKSGHYLGCNRLEPASTAVTVRVSNGKVMTTDGPFAETKEQLGGYLLIEARDLDEAIRIAATVPVCRNGCVEVRAVAEDPVTRQALRLDEESVAG
jgi:hypothetical protein